MNTEGQKNYQAVLDALRADPEPLIAWAAQTIVYLGSKAEWSMDDNFSTTEGLARLSDRYSLDGAYDQTDDALRFFRRANDYLNGVDIEPRCADCGEVGETTGHMECQYPKDRR